MRCLATILSICLSSQAKFVGCHSRTSRPRVLKGFFIQGVGLIDEEYDENGFLIDDEEKIRALMLQIRPFIFEEGKCQPEIVIPALLRILGYIVGMGEVGGDLREIYNQMIKDIEHSRKISEVAAESFKLFDRLRTGSKKDDDYAA